MDGTEQAYGWTPAFAGVTGFYLIEKHYFSTPRREERKGAQSSYSTSWPGIDPAIYERCPEQVRA
jgi:hypothetical protein